MCVGGTVGAEVLHPGEDMADWTCAGVAEESVADRLPAYHVFLINKSEGDKVGLSDFREWSIGELKMKEYEIKLNIDDTERDQ